MYFSKKLVITSALSAGMLLATPAQGMSYLKAAGNSSLSAIAAFNQLAATGSHGERFIKSRCVNLVKSVIPGLSFVTRWGGYAAILKEEWIRPAHHVRNHVGKVAAGQPHTQHKNIKRQKVRVAQQPILQPVQKPKLIAPKSFKDKTVQATKTLARMVVCDEMGSALSGKIAKPLQRATNRIFGMRLGTDTYENASFLTKALHFTILESIDELVGKNAGIIAIIGYSIATDLAAKALGY